MKNNKVEFLVGAIFAMASFSMAFPLRNGVGAFSLASSAAKRDRHGCTAPPPLYAAWG